MSKKLKRQERRLAQRRAAFDAVKKPQPGAKRPGSMNSHKSMPLR